MNGFYFCPVWVIICQFSCQRALILISTYEWNIECHRWLDGNIFRIMIISWYPNYIELLWQVKKVVTWILEMLKLANFDIVLKCFLMVVFQFFYLNWPLF